MEKEKNIVKLLFEGEYLNDKRNGIGKAYNYDGILLFEGIYLNDIEWIGTIYDNRGEIIDNLKNDINGKGKEYYRNEIIFDGEYLNGIRNGKGKEYYIYHNLLFKGEYLNDKKWEGKGYNIIKDEVYELKDGKGLIKEYFIDNTLKFEGQYSNGEKNGNGKEFWNRKLVFEGLCLNGKRN